MKTMDICICPAALGSKFSEQWEDRGMFSIGYNSLTGVDPAGREAPIRACRFSDIEKPSQTPIFADTPFGPTASKYRGYVFDPLNTPSSQLNQVDYRYNTPLCADVDLVAGSSDPPGKLKPIIARHLPDGNGNGVCNVVMADGSVKGYSARQILQQDKGPALHWRFRDLRGR
jgi:prepilin-type processing-associated H-X9-DG protein